MWCWSSCGSFRAQVGNGWRVTRSAAHDAAVAVHDGDGLFKLLSLSMFELAKPVSDLVDQTADLFV
ncbi:hypothetical protein A8144_11315 [Mycobacterium leprae 3125609]|nr:hypothetical protein A8144_11315 [Mycobacterium leprae 3125609]OAX70655.1 hypothetical protein A3216_10650 [Mycobacterium leprae 7935681]